MLCARMGRHRGAHNPRTTGIGTGQQGTVLVFFWFLLQKEDGFRGEECRLSFCFPTEIKIDWATSSGYHNPGHTQKDTDIPYSQNEPQHASFHSTPLLFLLRCRRREEGPEEHPVCHISRWLDCRDNHTCQGPQCSCTKRPTEGCGSSTKVPSIPLLRLRDRLRRGGRAARTPCRHG